MLYIDANKDTSWCEMLHTDAKNFSDEMLYKEAQLFM
jgi:hypothetical protein